MINFILNIFITIYIIIIWILITSFIFIIVNDQEEIKRSFARFIIRICKTWEVDTNSLFFTINQIKD
jgi:hypothetical protein